MDRQIVLTDFRALDVCLLQFPRVHHRIGSAQIVFRTAEVHQDYHVLEFDFFEF